MAQDEISIGHHRISVSNRDKVLFPDTGITKGELIDYYRRIADVALPHLHSRPLTMQRFPDGIGKGGFFQKDMPDHFPDWVDRVELSKEDGSVTYVVANDAATLVFLANQACITLHVGLARVDRPHHPDRMILDLDPSDDDFAKVRDGARWLRDLLDELGLASFVQTTGSRGLHVVVPLDRSQDFDTVRGFARDLARRAAGSHPDVLTVQQRKNQRGDRVFVDYLRNAYGQTAVAPYSVRAIEGSPVATPLRWGEIGASGPGPRRYTIANIFRRLAQTDDPWADIARRATPLGDARRRLDELA